MRTRLLLALAALLPAVGLEGQAPPSLPPDIHPVTLSRLPPVTPADLDAEGQKLLAARTNVMPGPGPTHVTIYSPKSPTDLAWSAARSACRAAIRSASAFARISSWC